MSKWQKEKEEEWAAQTAVFHRILMKKSILPLGVLIVSILILAVFRTLLTLPTIAAAAALYFLIKQLAPAFCRKDTGRIRDLARILTSPQEIEQFDAEMAGDPVEEIELLREDGRLYFTEHYLVRQTGGVRAQYRVFRLDEIKSSRVFANPRTTIVGSSTKPHLIEFYSQDRKTIGFIEIRGRAACVEFEVAYYKYLPNAHWNLGKYILK